MSKAAAVATPSAYVGLRFFTDSESDRKLFFAREKAGETLRSLVLSERLSVLYARSGLGKTSLINVELLTPLRERGFFCPVVRLEHKPDDPLGCIYNAIAEAAKAHNVEVTASEQSSLWRFFDSLSLQRDGNRLRPALIIDQFEELFTLVKPTARREYERFRIELADLARGRMPEEDRKSALARLETLPKDSAERERLVAQVYQGAAPDVRILLSIREDFLPELQDMEERIPGIFRNTLRLRPFTRDEATHAILEPLRRKDLLKDGAFDFEQKAVESVLDFLSRREQPEERGDEYCIEPSQLQLLCSELDRRRRSKAHSAIRSADLGGAAGMRRILADYYFRAMRSFPILRLGWNARRWKPFNNNAVAFHYPRTAVRELCEQGLITSSQRRNSLIRDDVRLRYGVSDEDLQALVGDHRLLRSEPRLGNRFYELAHDTLVAPIVGARRRRTMIRWGMTLSFFFVAFILPVAWQGASIRYQEAQKVRMNLEARLEIASLGGLPPQQRIEKVKALLANGYNDLSGAALQGIELRGRKDLYQANFSDADLRSSIFTSANLGEAQFGGAKLQGADLSSAYLANSSFRGADLTGANLSRAILLNADLAYANLVAADLTDANLTSASLQSSDVSGVRISPGTKLTDSAWWLATGWSDDDIVLLQAIAPNINIAQTARYKDDLAALDKDVRSAPGEYERAVALNGRAWYRVTRNAELEQARKDAEDAVRLLRNARSPATRSLANTLDTLGMVLVRQGKYQEALPVMEEAVRRIGAGGDCAKMSVEDQEILYHLAMVLEGLRRHDEAAAKMCTSKYRPTHERLRVPQRAKVK